MVVLYINISVIYFSIKSTIKTSDSTPGRIVGIKQFDGTYPLLDFKNARNAGSTAGSNN